MACSNQHVEVRYRMRHNNVLIKITPVEKVRGLFMPEASMQGVQYIVEEIGPEVKDLKKGDVVLVTGKPGVDIGLLPNDSKMLVAPEDKILLIIEPVIEEKETLCVGEIGSMGGREEWNN